MSDKSHLSVNQISHMGVWRMSDGSHEMPANEAGMLGWAESERALGRRPAFLLRKVRLLLRAVPLSQKGNGGR